MTATSVSFTIPIRTISEANARDGWRRKAKRAQAHRGAAKLMARTYASAWLREANATELTVTLVRHGPKRLDFDNLCSSQKAVIDGIADFLGINDNDPRVTWAYEQQVSSVYGVGVRIEKRNVAQSATV